jgi:hypothetical protein
MSLPKKIKLTPDGGFYYKAIAFNLAFTIPVAIPVMLSLLVAVLNPFWFRDDFFHYVENTINRLSKWRNYRMYAIYLGCDPKMWHTLKDTHEDN